jgi:hypothetical protein
MTRPGAWTSGNTQSTRISFQSVHARHQPTAKTQVNHGFQSRSRLPNYAGNVPLQRLSTMAAGSLTWGNPALSCTNVFMMLTADDAR